MKSFIGVLLFLAGFQCFAQQSELDSLSTVWSSKEYEDQVDILKKLVQEYAYINSDSSEYYLSLLKNTVRSEDSHGQMLVFLLQSNRLYDLGLYDSSLHFSYKTLELAIAKKDTSFLSRVYLNLGSAFDAQGYKDSAIQNYLYSIEMFQSLEDSLNAAYLKINIGLLFKSMEDFAKAESYYLEALAELEHLQDVFGMATINTNLASMYETQGKYREAIGFAEKGERLYVELGYKIYAIYPLETKAKSRAALGQLKDALLDFQNGISVARENAMNEELFTLLIGCAKILIGEGSFTQASQLLNEASLLAGSSGSLEDLRDLHQLSYQTQRAKGQWREASNSLLQYQVYKDSILNKEKITVINGLETKYKVTLKEKEISDKNLQVQTQKATIANQKSILIAVASGAGFLLLIGFIFYNRKQAEQKQKLQAERETGYQNVINATEEERKRISKDLHDGIGQQLSALKLALVNLSKKVSDEGKEEIEKISERFSKSADDVRTISHQMMPRALMENGLLLAIEDLLQGAFQFSEIKYQFEHRLKSDRFDEKIEISLYRITQELINNIIKHAGATEVSVQLIEVKNQLTLFVEDNGVGLSTKLEGKGMGLLNIQSRLEIVQGKVNYEQGDSSGTSAIVTIPLG
ncbi:MAG: sensor histidine kinase [Bacteroidota bacterium]